MQTPWCILMCIFQIIKKKVKWGDSRTKVQLYNNKEINWKRKNLSYFLLLWLGDTKCLKSVLMLQSTPTPVLGSFGHTEILGFCTTHQHKHIFLSLKTPEATRTWIMQCLKINNNKKKEYFLQSHRKRKPFAYFVTLLNLHFHLSYHDNIYPKQIAKVCLLFTQNT